MSAMSGHHVWISRLGLLGHTAMRMRKQPNPAYKRCVAERNSPGDSDGRKPQRAIRPERPKNWQQFSGQGNQKGPSTPNKFPGDSDGQGAQRANRPERPKKWQQSSAKGSQKGPSTSQPGFSPKKSAGRAPQQIISVESLRTPPQITTFIKQQEQVATGLTRGAEPEAALTSFCASMEGLLSRPRLHMNYIPKADI